jgi:hypothetical protein
MRFIRPVFALLVALSLAAAALAYLQSRPWEDRVYLQDHRRPSPAQLSFNSTARTTRAAHRAAPSQDPYHQRYYSESEGWTYYTLPALGSGRAADKQDK